MEEKLLPYIYDIIDKKIKERGIPEDVVKRLMKELKEMGPNNEGEALRQESEDVFREDLIAELTDRYVQKHLSDEEIEALENVELSDEKYQEIIDKIFGK